jgi:hypothetical protein
LKHRKKRRNARHALRAALCTTAILGALIGCRAPPPQAPPPVRPAAPADARPPVDASYDWHGLLVAPFGSVLKDIPLTLHEVLLFRDDAHGSAAVDDAECYAADTPAPRFLGRTPEEYLLCFKQDRLARIQASVRLPSAEAPEVFATACAGWLKNHIADAPAPASAPVPAQGSDACKGRDGVIRFSAHTEEESDSAETTLSITLDSAPDP